jgi:hypothetical protein
VTTPGNLTVSPSSAPPSILSASPSTLHLSASNLPANTQVTAVYLIDDGNYSTALTPSVSTTSSTGTLVATVTMPSQAVGGTGSIQLLVGTTMETTPFQITPVLTINGQAATSTAPVPVQPGQSVQVAGAGFKASTVINFFLNASTQLTTSPSAVATDPHGNLSASVTIPTNVTAATYYISTQDQSGGEITYGYIYGYTSVASGTPTATATATAKPTPLGVIAVQGLRIQTSLNTALSNVTVGTFTDSAGLSASSYTISISWGDGSASSSASNRGGISGGAHVRPAGVSQQYTITGSHTYTSAGTFPTNVTIHATDGRTAYLTSIAQVGTATATTTYQLSVGWNLIGPQLSPGTTVQASVVAASILTASGGNLVALYGLTNNQWSPYYVEQHGHVPSGQDFALHGGQGYLVYTDTATSFTIGSAAQRESQVIHAGLTPAQRAQVPPLPPLP